MPTHEERPGLNQMIGLRVIVRTVSAGVWYGVLGDKYNAEVILHDARRMWRWFAIDGISLSECATNGIVADKSRITAPVESVWMEAIEIIPCTPAAVDTFLGAPYAKPS